MKTSTPPPISDKVISDMRALIESGVTREEAIANMRRDGLHIVECIKLTRSLYGLTLGEAKEVVQQSEAWTDCREQNDAFHEQVVEVAEQDGWNVSGRNEPKAASVTAA
jgi:hypothetical protein